MSADARTPGTLAADVPAPVVAEVARWLREVLPADAALRSDSRLVRAGDAFFAFPGLRDDGRNHVAEALARGAVAFVYESDGRAQIDTEGLPSRAVTGLRELSGYIASEFHDRPSEHFRLVAVTGTNGKTTTSQWIANGLHLMGRPSAVVGTLGSGVVGELGGAGLTTPDALGLQALFAGFVERGIEFVAAEASSIGIEQGRLNGTQVEVAVFTNLTRDHLDYHGTMQAYADVKARLFGWPGVRTIVVNGDDPYATLMSAAARSGGRKPRCIGFGLSPGQHGLKFDAALIAERVYDAGSGIATTIGGDFGRAELRLPMLGGFAVSNALAVAASWLALGVSFEQVIAALQRLPPVPGRMEAFDRPGAPAVVIDYAHSPDALALVLSALRPVAMRRGGQLWCVFGAGGDRDAGKRPMMGMAVEQGADHIVITSDNPRGESPFRIVSDIRAGLSREPELTELDRAVAIRTAIERAAPEDVVLVAGKGHETTQEIAGERLAFSDREHALAALTARARAAGTVQPPEQVEGKRV